VKLPVDIDSIASRQRQGVSKLPAKLRGDCAACCGLCCVVFAFDASQGFGFDKPAHTSCAMLSSDDRCSIHDELLSRGFPGCAAYDCYGAGQWVVRHFAGASWRDSPQIAAKMFDAFWRGRVLHQLSATLTLALTDIHDDRAQDELRDWLRQIEALCDAGPAALNDKDVAAVKREVMTRLRKLSLSPPQRSVADRVASNDAQR
jgi:hypothetical protein